jgi:GTPase SAR1 family protein
VLIFYDLTDETSFHNISDWLSAVEEHIGTDVVIMLIGNKLDVVQEEES